MFWFVVDILMLRRLGLGRPFRYAFCWCCCSAVVIAGLIYTACRIPCSRRKEPVLPMSTRTATH